MEIKHQIREAMDRAALSVRDVSRAVGVSNQSVRFWLGGQRAPRRQHLPALERVLKTRIDMSAGLSVQLPHSEDLMALAYPEIKAFASLPPCAREGLLQTVRIAAQSEPEMCERIAAAVITAALAVCGTASVGGHQTATAGEPIAAPSSAA
jgi:transcriptional regulator with XRE-family HTH domain